MEISELAEFMHIIYERKAVEHGWQTQQSCRVKFDDLPAQNKILMLEVAAEIINKFANEDESG